MNNTNKTKTQCKQIFAAVLVVMAMNGCGGGGGSSGAENETFSVQLNKVTIRRLDNNESVPVEGAASNGATVTLN